ncbi:MAG: hypothetical protein JSR54_20290, partial [Proteobacteria bacterium]|nr:hypothetical protein [Pseudomonadota bacterium]
GRGLPDRPPGHGLGMRTMRYRAAAIGGRLAVQPRQPSGTAVTCLAPQPGLQAAADVA